MPGKDLHLTPLPSRKLLWLAESELNRAPLINEWHDLRRAIHQLKEQTQAFGFLASSTVKLATTFSAVCSVLTHHSEEENGQGSRISTLLNGVRTGLSWGCYDHIRNDLLT